MDNLQLIRPSIVYADQIMTMRQEMLNANDEDSFAGCGDLRECKTVEQWLDTLARRENPDTVPSGYVSSNTYLAVRTSDDRPVGIIDLRHHIDHPVLGVWGGHMGYIVRPSERGHGYAREMLRLNLENCRARGMKKILITCSRRNIASEKTIVANGGVFEKEILVDGDPIRRYWIEL